MSFTGSFFAGVYALYHWRKIWGSGHSLMRKIAFMFEDLYQTYNLIFSWFALVSVIQDIHNYRGVSMFANTFIFIFF